MCNRDEKRSEGSHLSEKPMTKLFEEQLGDESPTENQLADFLLGGTGAKHAGSATNNLVIGTCHDRTHWAS